MNLHVIAGPEATSPGSPAPANAANTSPAGNRMAKALVQFLACLEQRGAVDPGHSTCVARSRASTGSTARHG